MSLAHHPLDDPSTWPVTLRVAADLCQGSPYPVIVCWGEDLLITTYSNSFQQLLGDVHPVYGLRVRDLWSDLWPAVEPQFHHVLRGGAGVTQDYTGRDAGGSERSYEIAYSALHGDGDSVAGVLVTLFDRTQALAEQRHTAALVRLMSATNHSRDLDALAGLLLDVLQDALQADSLALYLREGEIVRLTGYRGDPMYTTARPHTMHIGDDRMPARHSREAHAGA